IIEQLAKDGEKNVFWSINDEIQESLLSLKNTMYHSRHILRISRLKRIQDHCLTLKNMPLCMTRSSNKELVEPYDEPEEVKEEITETIMEPAMEEYMKKTREDYESCVARPKFDKDAKFELKGQFLKELRDHTFSG
ncbi:hypothetical protein Tco_1342025, partial [Tanacetum coccineum]